MKPFDSARYLLATLMAIAMVAGCGGSQGNGPGIVPPASGVDQTRAHKASGSYGDLLYVSGDYASGADVAILTYPQGRFVKNISGIGELWGMCSDTSGNVWVVTGGFDVYEFAHGGTTPIAHVTVQKSWLATGCAVDPTTGALAVINYDGPSGPSVDVWQDVSGAPVIYQTSFTPWTVTYDGTGDLFAVGLTNIQNDFFRLGELPRGKAKFQDLNLDKPADWPGGIQWDGKHVVIDTGGRTLTQRTYQVAVRGSRASVVKTLQFGHMAKGPWMTWIHGDTIISTLGRHQHARIALWDYPSGGKPYKILSSYTGFAVVSVAPSQK